MTWLEVTAAAAVAVTWPVTQFAVMAVTLLLPGAAADRARARWQRRAITGEDTHG